ncbi:MAG TPA: hypothetical protein VF868_10575 [Bacteroidia bacterium]
MPLYATSTFRKSLERLCESPRLGYATCPKDIIKQFSRYTVDQMWERQARVGEEDGVRIIKLRMPNSGSHQSSADGFRVVHVVIKKSSKVIFLDIFPKRGKYAKSTANDAELERYMETFASEAASNSLLEVEFRNNEIVFVEKAKPATAIEIPPQLFQEPTSEAIETSASRLDEVRKSFTVNVIGGQAVEADRFQEEE